MRKLIALTLTLVALLTLTAPATAEDAEVVELYAVITALDYVVDTATCLTEDGELWIFHEIEDFFIGDEVILTIWIPGEEIVDVQYVGFLTAQEMKAYIYWACE